ncbi:diguanylate cyclase (GGDEF) domain-containing protein [Thermanaeromonas toyohensis ToBE]|uniref:Diguanylate cyclase (GGDEF) domain-containing protein n=1 Tax=Thermanaeromonas toyohensis ToBE TaxID=698762 RepID=A0A1W1VEF4_9FIRM|nr:GGDEF domain-containing protein [Thermanaeromonas toyohensis]SMB91696.1 diguanylate cyclase (GGDEF) domain-containing protein [Thermanaeromonas toyohensis ToBE]
MEGIFAVGTYPWVLGGVLFYTLGAVLSLAGVYFFFLDVERTIAHLKKEAETDFLTGLYNRKYFIKRLEDTLYKYPSHGRFAVAILDLDNMKEINDRLGHQKGDEVLKAVGGALKKSVGPEDIVARYGGDEFAILFRSDGPEVKKFPERLAENLVFKIPGIGEIPVSISVGLAFYPDDGQESGTLVAVADRRMYKHKLNLHKEKDKMVYT